MITPVGASRKSKWRAVVGSPGKGKTYVVALEEQAQEPEPEEEPDGPADR